MNILVVALQKNGKNIPSTFEAISVARSLDGDVFTAILGSDTTLMADELVSRGGGKVLAVANPALGQFNEESYVRVLQALILKYSPDLVLCPATVYGKGLMARLGAALNAPVASDVTGLALEDGKVRAVRPNFGGSVLSTIEPQESQGPFLVSIRPKIFAESSNGSGEVVNETVDESCFASRSRVIESKVETAGSENLAEADVIVSAGRDIKSPEHAGLVKELANSLGGALGASRAVVDAGWLPYLHQVGQTGKTVNPKLYIAVGISGAIQHLVGMQSSQTIVAINKDKDAPIFNVANYGIVADLFDIVPALTKKFKQELQR